MKWVFWVSLALIVYPYAGYPLWLWLRSLWRERPVQRAASTPSVSILMVVHNEERLLPAKLENLKAVEYPGGQKEIVVVSDGSSDATERILVEAAERNDVRVILRADHAGKACGLNAAMGKLSGDIVVFTDVRQKIEAKALLCLMENFADSAVGCASGELMLGDPEHGERKQGAGLYWWMEKKVRQLESRSGSVVGATGAFYAVRRSLIQALPPGAILDDVLAPLEVARQGYRVVLDPAARAWDDPHLGIEREFQRKVRTLTGNYQLVQVAPWLLSGKNPLRFEFVSHKLLRLIVPFALAALLVSSALLTGLPYRFAFIAQLGFYGLGALAAIGARLGIISQAAEAAWAFVVLNSAALVAFRNFVTRRKVVW